MKKMLRVIYLFFLPVLLLSSPSGERLNIEVQLLPTAQFNLSDWNDPAINLWLTTLINNDTVMISTYIEFRLDVTGVEGISAFDNPVVWGVTNPIDVYPNAPQTLFSDYFSGDGTMQSFSILSEFQSIIEKNGYLPAGDYDIKMLAWTGAMKTWNEGEACSVPDDDDNELLDISWDHNYVDSRISGGYDDDWDWNSEKANEYRDEDRLSNVLINTINIQEPVIDANVIDPYPWFRWDSPGFRSGVSIDYRIRVAQFNPELHSSFTDALEDFTSVFFDTEWQDQYNSIYRITENGSPQQISIQFPSGDRDLACGYQYVWQVEAREFLDDATTSIFNMSGFSGVWGWPEPTKSSIYTFNFGSRLTKDNVTSPTEGSQVNSVLPSFNWESVSCASEYELWLSDAIDDPDVENPFYQSEPIQSLPFQYPFDAPGLMPGKRYTWKVRYNPNGEISPWSEIISFTASESELTEPAQGDMITTVLPLFNADLPNDVAAIELRIGDIEDENVEMANIYSEIITGLPFQYPRDAAIGLFPGQKYFWKMIILDANDNMVGLPDEYQNIGNFTISAMNYLTPDQNEMEVVLQPIFSWESPNEVASFELAISDENDPDVQNPSIIFNVTGSFYQYPVDAEIQLEHSKDYYWTLKAQDENGNLSDPLAPRKFRTQEKPLQAAPELQVNGLTEKCPCEDNLEFTIMWTPVAESEYYHFIISESREIGEDKLLSERLFEVEDLSLTSIQLSYEDYAFEYGLPYYIQVIATKEEEFHSYPSEILNINYCQLKDMDSKPEFRIEAGISEPRLLNIYLDTELECASSYSLKLSSEPDMSTSLLESGELQNFPYSWEACIDNLEFSTNYYVQMQGLIDGDAHGQLSDIMTVSIKEEPGSVDIPEVSVTLSADRPICPLVNYNQVVNAQSSRIIISTESETNDEGILTAQLFSIGEIRQTNINLCDLDIVLEYTQQYYLQVQGENEGESFGLASEIVSFTTLNQPGASDKFEFALTTSTVDPCTYQINLLNGVSGSDNYYIEFSESSEIDNIVLTLNIQNFPAEFTVDGIELLWDTPYYVRGQAIQNDLSHGLASDIASFQSCPQPGSNSKPEFSMEISQNDFRKISINLLSGVENAEEYTITISQEADLSAILFEEIVSLNSFPYTLVNDNIEYLGSYFVALQGLMNGGNHGQLSSIQSLLIPAKPGANEQPSLYISLQTGNPVPVIEISNMVTGANSYLIEIGADADMNTILYEFEVNSGTSVTYPESAPQPEYGMVYYFRITALDNGFKHGLISSIFSIYIPSVIPPQPEDNLFSWSASEPPSQQYILEVSTTENFNSIVINEIVNGVNFSLNMDNLSFSTSYFWRVRGLDNNGEVFGNYSSISYFETKKITGPELLNPVSTESSLLPEFSWVSITEASSYIIDIATDADFTEIIWTNNGNESNIKYLESALKLTPSSKYFWKITALGKNDEILSQSVHADFTTEGILFVKDLDPNGVGIENLTPTFKWSSLEQAASYRITISSNADMSDIILESENSENSLLIEAGVLNNDQTYFWNVTALDADGEVLSDPVELAEFATPSQSAISLISPLETGLKSLQPTFQWNVFSGAATYNLMISSDNEFTAIIIDINSDKNSYNSNKESGCEYGSSYFWKVKALDEEGNLLSESSTGEFSFADLPAITLKSPDNDASISDVFPVFTWEGLEDAAAFNFQISHNADMSESRTYTVASNTFTYRDDDFPLEKNKVYHWLVYAINSDGGIFSKNSETRSFKREEQLALNLEKPGNSEKVTNKQPHFRWTAIEGAENYEIILASDESFSDIKWNIDNITENNVLYPSQGVDDLLADTKYFWKVRAYGKDQLLTDYSSSFNFELLLDLTPIANSPVGITAEDLNPTFTWSTIKGADHYEIHIGLDAEMSQVFFSETKIMQSRYKYPDTGVPPLPYDQQLYWYIVAVDEAGNTLGDPSAVVSFKTLTGIIELELVFSN